jgi:hypothetical protein
VVFTVIGLGSLFCCAVRFFDLRSEVNLRARR